jgi:hypothetical protein
LGESETWLAEATTKRTVYSSNKLRPSSSNSQEKSENQGNLKYRNSKQTNVNELHAENACSKKITLYILKCNCFAGCIAKNEIQLSSDFPSVPSCFLYVERIDES